MIHKVFNLHAKARFVGMLSFVAWWIIKVSIALAVIEVVLQFATPQYRNQIFNRELTGGYHVAMHKEGYRGEYVSRSKASGELRLLALGDSATFGTGVAASNTWPAQLQRIASAHHGGFVTSINAGVEGAHPKELEFDYRNHWHVYDPDVIILAVTDNMISRAWICRDLGPTGTRNKYLEPVSPLTRPQRLLADAKSLVHRFCLPSLLSENSRRLLYWSGLANHNIDPRLPYGPMLALGWQQVDIDDTLPASAWTVFRRDLSQLRDTVRTAGPELCVTYLPTRFFVFSSMRDNEKCVPKRRLTIDTARQIETICRDLNVPYVNAVSALRDRRAHVREEEGRFEPMYIRFDFVHLSPNGHRAVAEAVAVNVLQSE